MRTYELSYNHDVLPIVQLSAQTGFPSVRITAHKSACLDSNLGQLSILVAGLS